MSCKNLLNNVWCCDVLEGLGKIENESVELIIADPPYYLLNKDWDRNQFRDYDHYLDWCFNWLLQCNRVLKTDGSIYLFQDWRTVAEFVILCKKIFPNFRNWITWQRIKGRASKTNFKSSKEEILYFCKSQKPIFNPQYKLRPVIAPYRDENGKPKGWTIDENGNRIRWTGVGNVWNYTPPVWSSKEEKPFHPTQKPLMMMERMVLSSSQPNGLVIDLFGGSGTTSIICAKLNRQFICIENNSLYCEKIKDRLKNVNTH